MHRITTTNHSRLFCCIGLYCACSEAAELQAVKAEVDDAAM